MGKEEGWRGGGGRHEGYTDNFREMIGFRGISAPGPASPRHDDDGHLAPTKEAQDATNLGLYERALRAQRAGRDAHAAATYKELLAQPMLADVAPVPPPSHTFFAVRPVPHPPHRRCAGGCVGGQRGLGAAPQVPVLQKPGDARVPGAGLDGVRAILLQREARRMPTHAWPG